MAAMAKPKRDKPVRDEPASEAEAPKSVLEAAWQAFQAGDVVLARRAARQVIAGPREADEAAAKKLARVLFAGQEATATQVAEDIALRTGVPPRPYWFALVAALIWVGLLLLSRRV